MENLYTIGIDKNGLVHFVSIPPSFLLNKHFPVKGSFVTDLWGIQNNIKVKEFVSNIFSNSYSCEISFCTDSQSIQCFGFAYKTNKAFIIIKSTEIEILREDLEYDNILNQQKLNEKIQISNYDDLKWFADNLPVVVFEIILNSDGTFEFGFVNKEMKNFFPLFNKKDVNINNSLLFVRVHPEDKQRLMDSIKNVFKTNVWDIEFRIIENGETKWVKGYGRADAFEEGKQKKICTYLQDISELKKIEDENAKLIIELNKNIKELTQFSYITTHNLRGPLTNLISICKLINTDKIEDDLTKKLIEGFKVSTKYLNESINDLIKVLIIKEQINLLTEEVEFHKILNKVIESLNFKLLNSRATIISDFYIVPSVIFNKIYMENIFLSLISNSLKYYHPDRSPIINIKTIREINGNTKIIFSDNGIGMNLEKVKNKIFGFYQTFHRHAESKGIELYLIQSQITSLGGSIEVDSKEGIGTSFTIKFNRP